MCASCNSACTASSGFFKTRAIFNLFIAVFDLFPKPLSSQGHLISHFQGHMIPQIQGRVIPHSPVAFHPPRVGAEPPSRILVFTEPRPTAPGFCVLLSLVDYFTSNNFLTCTVGFALLPAIVSLA
jgi:hypothetical protein